MDIPRVTKICRRYTPAELCRSTWGGFLKLRPVIHLLSLVLSIVAAQGLLTAQQKPPYDLVRIKAASSESLTVERFGLQPAGENAIPLKGLTFPDMAAVQQQIGRYYFSNYDLRVMLLDEGLARLTDRST